MEVILRLMSYIRVLWVLQLREQLKVPLPLVFLCDYDEGNFSHGLPFVVKIVKEVLRKGLPKNVALNVNIPAMSDEQIKE